MEIAQEELVTGLAGRRANVFRLYLHQLFEHLELTEGSLQLTAINDIK